MQEKMRLCTCGNLFIPQGRGQIRCENCKQGFPRHARPYRCDIIEVIPDLYASEEPTTSDFYGRCQGYMQGICEMCLDFCEQNDWRGWKAESYEWWTGIKTLEDSHE